MRNFLPLKEWKKGNLSDEIVINLNEIMYARALKDNRTRIFVKHRNKKGDYNYC